MAKAALPAIDKDRVSHNLAGQRLGRKGRDTRERILAAADRLLAGPPDTPISLSAVAREASLGMTTLYLYFSDLTELLLAILEPIMASAEDSYMGLLRNRWPDEELGQHCLKFVEAFYAFWERHTRILHLRNTFAESGDERMRRHRIEVTEPAIKLLVQQMGGDQTRRLSLLYGMGSVLWTGLERLVTVSTDAQFATLPFEHPIASIRSNQLEAQARIIELGIRDRRNASRAGSS